MTFKAASPLAFATFAMLGALISVGQGCCGISFAPSAAQVKSQLQADIPLGTPKQVAFKRVQAAGFDPKYEYESYDGEWYIRAVRFRSFCGVMGDMVCVSLKLADDKVATVYASECLDGP